MRRPAGASVSSIPEWEKGFYESAFTHANIGRITRHAGGFEGLRSSLGDKQKCFPVDSLILLPKPSRNSSAKRGIEMRIEHSLPPDFLGRRPIRVLVVGAGGTGSAILMGLPYLHQAMRVWGHPYGLKVTIMDPDVVSATNSCDSPSRSPTSASTNRQCW
jgi:hypothetical protein